MALCRACCSHRARCSTSPAAGEVSVGAGEGDTLGIAPWKCSTAIQDPFQRLASPESNWAVLTESSAGCGVPIGGCLQLLRDISSLGTNGAAHRCHPSARIPSFFGVICQSDISPRASRFFAHILLLAKTSWKQSVGWAGRADAKDLLGDLTLVLLLGQTTWAASGIAAESTTVPEPTGQQNLDTRAAEGGQEKILAFNWAGPSPHPSFL